MNEEMYILFDNYLNDELSVEEKEVFENQLKTDSVVAEKFEIYKTTTAFLEDKFSEETIDFKKNLEAISKQNFSETTPKSPKVIQLKPWYYAVTASVVVFLGVWFLQGGNPEYGDFNQHEQAYFSERGDQAENLKLAQEAFNSKNYKEAIVYFEKVTKEYDRAEVRYFYAISLLEENDFSKAENILQELNNGTSIYKDRALWYLALSKLKQEKPNECKTILQKIPVEAEDYKKAKKLLKRL